MGMYYNVFKMVEEGRRLEIKPGNGKALRFAKIFQLVCLIIVGVFSQNLYWYLDVSKISNDIGLSANLLHTVTIVVVILAILSLASAYFVYRVMMRARVVNPLTKNKILFPFLQNMNIAERIVLSAHFLLIVMFTAVSVFGFFLGFLGDEWKITLPFFIVSAVLLIITFPTQKRWNNLLAKFTEPADGK